MMGGEVCLLETYLILFNHGSFFSIALKKSFDSLHRQSKKLDCWLLIAFNNFFVRPSFNELHELNRLVSFPIKQLHLILIITKIGHETFERADACQSHSRKTSCFDRVCLFRVVWRNWCLLFDFEQRHGCGAVIQNGQPGIINYCFYVFCYSK